MKDGKKLLIAGIFGVLYVQLGIFLFNSLGNNIWITILMTTIVISFVLFFIPTKNEQSKIPMPKK